MPMHGYMLLATTGIHEYMASEAIIHHTVTTGQSALGSSHSLTVPLGVLVPSINIQCA